jgi:hypothetical protein
VLSSEEAQARLEAFAQQARIPLTEPARAVRAGALGQSLAKLDGRRAAQPDRVAARIDGLSSRARRQLFAYLTPDIDDAVTRWWSWAVGAPYQDGWARRGFRSSEPADSGVTRYSHLARFQDVARKYRQPLPWHATWAAYSRAGLSLGWLLASEISAGDIGLLRQLTDQALGRDEVGGMGRHVVTGLLGADDPEGWSVVEQLLRTAQRQEGLRQVILESLDTAHPGALAHLLGVIEEERMARFSSVIRAVGTWFGEAFEVRDERRVHAYLAAWRPMLLAPPAADDLLAAEPAHAYLGLVAIALRDVRVAIPVCRTLLGQRDAAYAGHRLAAARLLAEARLPTACSALAPAFEDPDPRVLAAALAGFSRSTSERTRLDFPAEAVAPLLVRLDGLGKEHKVPTGLLGDLEAPLGSSVAADTLLAATAPETEHLVAPAFPHLSARGREQRVRRLAEDSARHRDALMQHLGDAANGPRSHAYRALRGISEITPEEAAFLEDLLRRKHSAVRRFALDLLARQPAERVTVSLERLRAGTADQARAADELQGSRAARAPASAADLEAPTVPDVLLLPASRRTPAVRPEPGPPPPDLGASCARVVTSLVAWLEEHADTEIRVGNEPQLLSSLRWLPASRDQAPALPELWGPWWERTRPTLTDGGLELLLISQFRAAGDNAWAKRVQRQVLGKLPDPQLFGGASGLHWTFIERLAQHELRASWLEPLLRATRLALTGFDPGTAHAPMAVHARRGQQVATSRYGGRLGADGRRGLPVLTHGIWTRFLALGQVTDGQLAEMWRLLRFVDEPEGTFDDVTGSRVLSTPDETSWGSAEPKRLVPEQPFRMLPAPEIVGAAFVGGIATEGDLVDLLLSARTEQGVTFGRHSTLAAATSRKPPAWATDERVGAVVAEVREALLEVESRRGDLPTAYSPCARQILSVYGVGWLARLLAALDKRPFSRGFSWTSSRESVLSGLVRRTFPVPDDTDDAVRAALGGLTEQRLLQLAVYAPQWAGHVERLLGWPAFESAVWWLHAHTKDESWSVNPEIRAEWNAAVSQRTPLDNVDLIRGAADVAWFLDVATELGDERFARVLKAAKYGSSAGGHKRAELFARALRGEVPEDELLSRITTKRHQDSVRALGLLPLPADDPDALLRRYELLRRFVASDRSSGSARRASEASAVAVGMENLARTAGLRDPQRLIWAMEAEAVRDLAAGPVVARHEDLTVTLTLTSDGTPELDVRRGERALKSVPAAAAKVPEIAALRSRVTELRQQTSRMRSSLEASCVAGERFERADLEQLFAHPVLAPMLRELVVVSDEGVVGFAVDPTHVRDAAGDLVALDGSAVRIAHPWDLLHAEVWPELQHVLFTEQRRQPFRQVFRELYTLVESERERVDVSRRYAGHQVQARVAGGLFAARGWVADFETGFVRTMHAEKITVWCSLLDGWGSPTEVEDATIEEITFHRTGAGGAIPLTEVPPRLFSEVMRDLDLVVSVAHSGGVDPETSESSVELRRRLVEETAGLLGLGNVETTDHHAAIRGTRATYSVNLGSGVVHRRPGNAVCIVPVSGQHRGRVFLPFADDDPRTAEVIAKVVLLARDDTISDPTILEQLRGPG